MMKRKKKNKSPRKRINRTLYEVICPECNGCGGHEFAQICPVCNDNRYILVTRRPKE